MLLRHSAIMYVLLAGTTICALRQNLAIAQSDPQPSPVQAPVAASAGQDALPITRVMLYRSGVGAFMRSGFVDESPRLSLRFDASQLNDVLKSLQLLDLDGGRIDAVSYASKDPLERRLGSFSIPLADNPSLPTLFTRLRGSSVTLRNLERVAVTGTVLSVEVRKVPSGEGPNRTVIDEPTVNLLTSTGIRSIPISTISSFTLDDAQLQDEMNRALKTIAESRAERTKIIDLQLSGTGRRRIAATYVHENPVWKTSYRLLLPDAVDPAKPDPKETSPVLKGWALVENTTDSDWTNVRLSLVSGRPVSFKMDLAEPMYVFRPEVAVPTVAGVMPREYEGGAGLIDRRVSERAEAGRAKAGAFAPAPTSMPMIAGGSRGESAPGAPSSSGGFDISGSNLADYGMRSVAKGSEVGEQFQFELLNPVTIERQRSAMIPIIDANIQGQRVSIYNRSERPDHPMRGVRFTNTSKLQLLPGPIAVYDGSAYAGDAQIGQVPIGDNRLLAYALDLDVAVQTTEESREDTVRLRIIDGMFQQSSVSEQAITYRFDNKDLKRGRNVVLEHPKFDGWDLISDLKPDETTQSLYRFAVALDAGKTSSVTIKHSRTNSTTFGLTDLSLENLLVIQRSGKVSQAVVDAFKEAAKRNASVRDLEAQSAQLQSQIETSKRDQTQITDMLAKLDKANPSYATVSTRLASSLEKLTTLEASLEKTSKALNDAITSRNNYIRTLSIE